MRFTNEADRHHFSSPFNIETIIHCDQLEIAMQLVPPRRLLMLGCPILLQSVHDGMPHGMLLQNIGLVAVEMQWNAAIQWMALVHTSLVLTRCQRELRRIVVVQEVRSRCSSRCSLLLDDCVLQGVRFLNIEIFARIW